MTSLIEKLTAALELQQARSKELESAISTTVEDLCLRAERASDSDVAQMLWGIAEDLEEWMEMNPMVKEEKEDD